MRALTVKPGVEDSGEVSDIPEPAGSEGSVLVSALAVGICGTDREIVAGAYGEAPPGEDRLVLGHESVGRVLEAVGADDLSHGDLVVGIVRRADPVPCPNCAVGEWDMCRNGRYTEHGIKGLHGFARDRYRLRPDEVVRVAPELGTLGVLLEPASVVAKAWEHVVRIGARALWRPRIVLITGAGPVGLLAALLGVQRGLEVHVLDRLADGPKPALAEALGATYHATPVEQLRLEPDVVIECTGAAPVVASVLGGTARNSVVCLAGVSSPGRRIGVDFGRLNREWVLENDVVFGSVNANRRHYEAAAEALALADPDWLSGLITRTLPIESHAEALKRRDDDIKTIVTF